MTADRSKAIDATMNATCIVACLTAERLGLEPDVARLSVMHHALAGLTDEAAGDLIGHLNCALDLLEGKRS